MIYYYSIYAISIFFVALSFSTKNKIGNSSYYFFLVCGLLSLSIFSSLRSVNVGTDTWLYAFDYQGAVEIDDFYEKIGLFSETGYHLLKYAFRFFTENFSYMIFYVCLIITTLYIKTIFRLSSNPLISFIVFLLLGYYTFHFNALRQAVACAIFFYSIEFILNRDFKKYLVCVCIGFLFHKSMIICLPLYYLVTKRPSLKQLILIFVSLLIGFYAIGDIVNFISSNIDSRYSGFGRETDDRRGLVTALFHACLLFYFYFFYRYLSDDKLYNVCINLVFIGTCISVISIILKLDPNGIARVSFYFIQFSILIFPSTLQVFSGNLRIVAYGALLFILLIYSYLTLSSFGNMIPFEFKYEFFV